MTNDSIDLGSWSAVAQLIGRRITELKLSQRELVERSGVSSSTWRSVLAGGKLHRPDKVRGVCAALGWTPDSIDLILSGSEPKVALTRESAFRAMRDAAEKAGRLDVFDATQRAMEDALMSSPAFQTVRIAAKAEKVTPEIRAKIEAILDEFLEDK